MGLIKKEILVKETSTMEFLSIIKGSVSIVNNFQNSASNKKLDGGYNDFFFADIMDVRNKNVYRVYSDACETGYNLKRTGGYIYYVLIDNENSENNTDTGTLPKEDDVMDQELDNAHDDDEIILEYDSFLAHYPLDDFESFDRPTIPLSDFGGKTELELQEIYGEEYTESNVAYFITISSPFEIERAIPIYKTDTVEYELIPNDVAGSANFNHVEKNAYIAKSNGVKTVDDIPIITVYYINNSISNTLFSNNGNSGIYYIKVNGEYLCNFTKQEKIDKPSLKRRFLRTTLFIGKVSGNTVFNDKAGIFPSGGPTSAGVINETILASTIFLKDNLAGKIAFKVPTIPLNRSNFEGSAKYSLLSNGHPYNFIYNAVNFGGTYRSMTGSALLVGDSLDAVIEKLNSMGIPLFDDLEIYDVDITKLDKTMLIPPLLEKYCKVAIDKNYVNTSKQRMILSHINNKTLHLAIDMSNTLFTKVYVIGEVEKAGISDFKITKLYDKGKLIRNFALNVIGANS